MKSLSKSSQIPLYQQVVEWIRESIYTGDLVEDDRIPSEYQIMDMLEVSRGTVKKAVAQLVKEGVIIQVQGKGTSVIIHFISINRKFVGKKNSLLGKSLCRAINW